MLNDVTSRIDQNGKDEQPTVTELQGQHQGEVKPDSPHGRQHQEVVEEPKSN